MAKVVAVCISEHKGTVKKEVAQISVKLHHGIEGDAHAGDWHRQISLLADESVDSMRALGFTLKPGAFAENILTRGIELKSLPIGTRLLVGDSVLRVTQIGKECHNDCEIKKLTGKCVMPTEGIFAVVEREGVIRAGDDVAVMGDEQKNATGAAVDASSSAGGEPSFTAVVITVSDRCASGERMDESGPAVSSRLLDAGYQLQKAVVVPDEAELISKALCRAADEEDIALIVTTGGTGFAPRDHTPEVTLSVCDRLTPGIPERMRFVSMQITPRGCLSRSAAGIRGRSLIVNLPGSPRGAVENLDAVLDSIKHGLMMLRGRPMDCAQLK